MSSSFSSFFAVTAALLVLPGCWVGDGRYVIRGTVYARSEEALTPVRGATVAIGEAREANRRAETPSDGAYAVWYTVGGMFPFIETGNPKLSFRAPGFEPRTVELQGPTETADVKRRACEPPRNDCFVLDVVLVPLAAPASDP